MSQLPVRFKTLEEAAASVASLPGNVAEVGVWQGKAVKFLSRLLPGKTIHLFDTFSGMPPEQMMEIDGDGWDKYSRNSLEKVQKFLAKVNNLQWHPGVFPHTASELPDSETFCLVNIDVDIYQPTLAACEFFYSRMVPGGIMVLNDYMGPKGATVALDEFFSDKPEGILSRAPERAFVCKSPQNS